MRRELATIQRVTVERKPPLVPCCYAESKESRWSRQTGSCGELIPYKPNRPCPHCGFRQMRATAPQPGPDSRVIHGDTAIIDADTGEVVVVYAVCASELASDLANTLRDVEFDRDVYHNPTTTTRLSGVAVTHRTFGYQPPVPIRRRYGCSRSQFNTEQPAAMRVLTEFCAVAEYVFRSYAHDAHEHTVDIVVPRVAPAWRIAGTPWTSGIINQTAALPYHVDRGNFAGSWSAMLGARHRVEGGYLHLADYDTYLAIDHGSITIFDGQSVVHGVTPLTKVGPGGYRYTTVTYAKRDMKVCAADPREEVKRAARETTQAEDRRLAGFKPKRSGR